MPKVKLYLASLPERTVRASAALAGGFVAETTNAVHTIGTEGVVRYLRRVTQPYRARAAQHFDPRITTYTERLLQRRPRNAHEGQ